MTFLDPGRLWLLVTVLALGGAYVVLQLRRSQYAVRFTNLRLLDRVAPRRPAWRRHVPAVLFLLMMSLMVVAFARPQAQDRSRVSGPRSSSPWTCPVRCRPEMPRRTG